MDNVDEDGEAMNGWERDRADVFPDSSVTNLAPLVPWLDLTGGEGGKAALDLTPQLIITFKALIVKHLIRYSQIVNMHTDMEKNLKLTKKN